MSARSLVQLARLGPTLLLAMGVAALAAALAWWGLIYGLMIEAGVLTLSEASWCMGDTSGLCRALATLCTQDHPLGLKVYSPELFWLALALLGTGGVGKVIALALASPLGAPSGSRADPWHRG
jgi:hypothetical protein